MTTWHLFRAAYATAGLLAVAAFGVGLAAIWTQSERVGQTAALFTMSAFFLGGGTFMCFLDEPEKPLPRAERKRLEAERARIETDRLIRRMEREAGL